MPTREYDAIVVGASFAGLAVARQLRGEVLLLDRHEVGTVQTSACGTPLWVPERLGVPESVLQVHDRLVIRGPGRTIVYELTGLPFCTFDFGTFCRGLLAQSRVRFLRASVTGWSPGGVETTEGRFLAPVLVDASGWRGELVNDRPVVPSARRGYSFGLETRAPFPGDDLCLWYDRSLLPRGLGWVFPVGGGASLIGLGSYTGASKLRPGVERLLEMLGTRGSSYHGAFFPNRLLRSTARSVFAVGDAAGQCMPLTAEGIRPAIYFGSACGGIVQEVLDGRLTLAQGLARYRTLVARYEKPYRLLRAAQWVAAHAPTALFLAIVALGGSRRFKPRWWPRYGLFGHPDARAVLAAP